MPRRPRILDELRQTRPFPSRADEALVSLLRTTDVLRRHLGRCTHESEVTPQQYNVLRILRGAGEQGIPTLEIASRMIEQTPGITRLLDRLEAKGLVRRQRCPEDRRQVLCWITEPGLELLAELEAPVARAAKEAFRKLSAAEIDTLLALLERLRSTCTA
ncbi:MAG TPA: MarR family transcriptional regulator [Thermoanaerobaculia bacterium]|nr:MarR family transcriptional regulator [Thermoanaerobaculia bacterium]